ncbi:enoyl-CoA hydratase-related protein [Pseudidiomarina andamanensis]|uniref:Gamma-carboxygeranoyl-CoA hydratase n=1 Tax=Pseudidiomarina andamanensis TaxID=1940690 RepID=A0AA92EQK4_9GAMM|nr:enoyl-CoA hydratase-related protein [Pseudidiomarina andamanensis]MDS0218147.1 enoyl-CoA hydratase-related protein [Pseudidiomarina andamanensis]QGT95032.1 gamma-carboxygeranoyl-CoA hydratase [Pseudidiomarina andamanensis]
MAYQAIDLTISGHVAYLTLNRPEVHNAFDDSMIAELLHALDDVRANDNVRVLVLQSNGKNFSAGADLGWMRSMAAKNYDENIADAGELSRLMQELDELPKPTIALVQGAAFGGAVGLAACCDIALATPASSFCLSEVKIGLIPAVISPYVMRAIGTRQSRRYMVTAERFGAEIAHQIGLVHEVVDDLQTAVRPLIDSLVTNSPAAVSAAKQLALDIDQQPLNANTRRVTIERIAEIRVSAEGQEGLSAFLEKRAPNWKTTQ